MFRAIISPILRSTRLWLRHQQATSSAHYTTSCKHSLVLLRMGEIITRNMLSWLKLLINCYCCIELVVYTNDSPFVKHTVTYARVCFSDKTNRLSAHSRSTSTTLLLVVTPHLRQSEKTRRLDAFAGGTDKWNDACSLGYWSDLWVYPFSHQS